MRNVQDMVVMRVSHEDVISPRDVRVDGRHIRHGNIIPAVHLPRVPWQRRVGWCQGRRWPKYSRKIRINENDRGAVGDPPPGRPQVFEGSLTTLYTTCWNLPPRQSAGRNRGERANQNRKDSHAKHLTQRIAAKSSPAWQRDTNS